MLIKQIIAKYKIFFILIIIGLRHTILISQGYTSIFYERLRDVVFSILTLFFIIYFVNLHKRISQFDIIYLIIANLFVLIFVIHLLRLIFGGLPCSENI